MDMLVYSPYTQRYEMVKATYDPEQQLCYTDISLYRAFVKECGNPQLKLSLVHDETDGEGFYNNINSTSPLKEYGYDVSKKGNLSSKEQQDMLSEILDLNIMSSRQIIDYLDFFMESHPARHYEEVRAKWAADRRFVVSYKANPERFLISERVSPKK